MEEKSPFSEISGYLWTVKHYSKTLRVDAAFFKYGIKKYPFSKIPGYVWTGPKL